MARYVILYLFGGVYMDHDIVTLANLEIFFGKCSLILFTEHLDKKITNCIMASIKRNYIFKNIFLYLQ